MWSGLGGARSCWNGGFKLQYGEGGFALAEAWRPRGPCQGERLGTVRPKAFHAKVSWVQQ